MLETFFGFIFYFVPYWEWIRLAFFVYLIQNYTEKRGVQTLYEDYLQPKLRDNKEYI